tara:strand:+ start:692 stop:1027 length:336 start_codon:yes stop_codon:yes gene_type:complete
MSDNFLTGKYWQGAEYRAKVLGDLSYRLTQGDVDWAMQQLDVRRATISCLMKPFRKEGPTSALPPENRGAKPGMQPLDLAVEDIVSRHFKGFYATRRKPTKTRCSLADRGP